jgi:hypothetical protein
MKVYIATPMYGGISKSNYSISMQNLVNALTRAGHHVTTTTIGNESLITRARNTLAHKFLKTDCDTLLFIDSDHGFNPDDVIRMLESDKELIGAIYPMKGIDWDKVRTAALLGLPNLESYSGIFAVNTLDTSEVVHIDQPFRVKHIGTGMMAIKRSVLDKLAPSCKTYKSNSAGAVGVDIGETVVEYFPTMIVNDHLLSEDYAFCHMWRELGNDVWAAPWVRINHSGDYTFSGQFSSSLQLAEEAKKKIAAIEAEKLVASKKED